MPPNPAQHTTFPLNLAGIPRHSTVNLLSPKIKIISYWFLRLPLEEQSDEAPEGVKGKLPA
jgi:hypothetical protein